HRRQRPRRPHPPVPGRDHRDRRLSVVFAVARLRRHGVTKGAAMPIEFEMAELLTGHQFFLHTERAGIGRLRMGTRSEQHCILLTSKSLLALSEACAKYAEELQDIR